MTTNCVKINSYNRLLVDWELNEVSVHTVRKGGGEINRECHVVVKDPDLLVIKGSALLSPASRCIKGIRSIDATKEYSLPRFGCW